jgi:hypothetical protein
MTNLDKHAYRISNTLTGRSDLIQIWFDLVFYDIKKWRHLLEGYYIDAKLRCQHRFCLSAPKYLG